MKIKRLELLHFGKFHNTILELKSGLNIIEGMNESGKTTIYHFIEGVFFGFVKPFLKTTRFEKDYEKYRPWEGTDYEGAIVLEIGDSAFRIYRDFQNKTYAIYDENTGKNIGSTLPGYAISNLSFPGEYFFNNSSNVFRNTFLIGQMNTKVDPNSVKEIGDGLSATDFEIDNYSCEKALQYLLEQKNAIGSERAFTKPFGQCMKEKELLTSEIQQLEIHDQKYFETLNELEKEKNKLVYLKNNQKALDWKERNQEILFLQKKKQERDLICQKLEEVDRDLISLKDVTNINADKLKDLYRILDNTREQLHQVTKEKKAVYHNKKSYEKILKENEKMDSLRVQIEDQKILIEEEKNRFYKTLRYVSFGLVFMIFVAAIDTFLLQAEHVVFLSIPFFVIAAVVYVLYSQYRKRMEQFEEPLQNLVLELANCEKNRVYISQELNTPEVENRFQHHAMELEEINQKIDHAIRMEEEKKAEIQKELDRCCLSDFNFDEYDQKISQWKVLQERRENLVQNLEQFDEYDFSDENLKITGHYDMSQYPIDNSEFLNRKMQEVISNISKLDERAHGLEKHVSERMEKKEAFQEITHRLEIYKNKLEAIQIAIEVINRAKNKLHKNFLPRMTERINQMMNSMTKVDRRFALDEAFQLSVLYEDASSFKDSDSLSQGTKDQMNISLRLSILQEMYGQDYFVIFDDAFVQYDDFRFINQVNALEQLTNHLQMLIFTCQVREKEMVDHFGLPHHYVRLE